MAVPKEKLWPRPDHTEGKHLVLKHYLEGWFPTLGMNKTNRRILFVDGFAGPGEYEGGEDGSPVVAMRVLAAHSAGQQIEAEVVFVFIERDPERARHLDGIVGKWRPKLPSSATVDVCEASFDTSMRDVFAYLKDRGTRLAPALVMMDPFGVKGIPLDIVRQILDNSKCEVYITFMWRPINMRVNNPEFEDPLDDMFGSAQWRDARHLKGKERREFLYSLYTKQLKSAGAQQVVHFHLYSKDQLQYSIFFGTKHTKGSNLIKQAIWKVAPFGDFNFRGGSSEQPILFGLKPDYLPLRHALQDRYGDEGWVTIEDVLDFVRSDSTLYHDGQVKIPILKPLEEEGLLSVKEESHRRRLQGTYPGGTRMRFKPRGTRPVDRSPLLLDL